MNIVKYCGAALCALCMVILLRGQKSGFSTGVAATAAVLLFGAAVSELLPVTREVSEMANGSGVGKWMVVMMKTLGIAIVAQFGADICRDSGETSIASKLEMVGKAEIILLALPLMRELIALAVRLVG